MCDHLGDRNVLDKYLSASGPRSHESPSSVAVPEPGASETLSPKCLLTFCGHGMRFLLRPWHAVSPSRLHVDFYPAQPAIPSVLTKG